MIDVAFTLLVVSFCSEIRVIHQGNTLVFHNVPGEFTRGEVRPSAYNAA